MGFQSVIFLLIAAAMCLITRISCNSEVNILHQWRLVLNDPNNVLQSWDPTLVNPCTWFHVTCNIENSVTRLDLGSAGLSGPLIPQLAQLSHLQYMELYDNNLSGNIPSKIGKLKNLVSLDLYHNHLSGPIPSSIGNLVSLRFLRLNSNKLSGTIPMKVIQLIGYGNLLIMNVTENSLAGTVPASKASDFKVTTIVRDPPRVLKN